MDDRNPRILAAAPPKARKDQSEQSGCTRDPGPIPTGFGIFDRSHERRRGNGRDRRRDRRRERGRGGSWCLIRRCIAGRCGRARLDDLRNLPGCRWTALCSCACSRRLAWRCCRRRAGRGSLGRAGHVCRHHGIVPVHRSLRPGRGGAHCCAGQAPVIGGLGGERHRDKRQGQRDGADASQASPESLHVRSCRCEVGRAIGPPP